MHLAEDRCDEPEGAAVPATGRPLHRGDRRHGLSGVWATSIRQRRHHRPIRHVCRHRPAVFPTWGAALTPGGFGRRIALAAAHRGAGLDLPTVSGVGPGREGCVSGAVTPPLWTGVILLCALPSTVQSSIAFTSIARGNVPAALCAATVSNLLGMGLTPLLVGLLLGAQGAFSARGAGDIVLQLLLPFAAGQLARPWIGDWALRHKTLLGLVDRGSILLVVYTAFSEGVTQGIWRQLGLGDLGQIAAVDVALLAAVLTITTYGSRLLGFSRADEV